MGRPRQNPSYREEDDPSSLSPISEHPTSPLHRSSPTPRTPAILRTPVVTRSSSSSRIASLRPLLPHPSASSSAAPRVLSSRKRLVMLLDWWLVPTERAPGVKGFGVAGLELKRLRGNGSRKLEDSAQRAHGSGCSGGSSVNKLNSRQKADRVFYSAPIIKRYDAFTLKTVDKIIVRLQGMINMKNTMNNGFPIEVCNHFLIGFPYNWVDLTDEYVRAECDFESLPENAFWNDVLSTHLNEFSMSRIDSFITSTCDAPPDCFFTNFTNILKRFRSIMSICPAKKMTSDKKACPENQSEHQTEDSAGNSTLLEADVECHAAVCSKAEFLRNDFDAGVGEESFTNITPNARHDLLPDSLLHLNLKMNALPEKEPDEQRVPSLRKAAELEKGQCSDMSDLVCVGTFSRDLKHTKGKLTNECATASLDLENKMTSDDLPPKDIPLSHNVRPKTSARYGGIRLSKGQGIELDKPRRSSRIAAKNKKEVSTSGLLSKDVLDLDNVGGNNFCFSVPKASSSNELNSECPTVLQHMEDHGFHAIKEPAAQAGLSFVTMNRTLELGVSFQNEPSSEFVGPQGKHLLMKTSEFMNEKSCIHNPISEAQGTVCKEMPAEENLKEKSSQIETNGLSAEETTDRHVDSLSISHSVVRKLNYTTRRGKISSPASVIRGSQCLSEQGKFSLNRGLDIVDTIPTADATPRVSRMKKLQNNEEGDHTIKRNLNVKKQGIMSVLADNTAVNLVNEVNRKHGSKHARDPVIVDALTCNLDSSPRELHKDAIVTGPSEVGISVDASPKMDAEQYLMKKKRGKKKKNQYVKTKVSADVPHMKDKASHSSGKTVWRSSYTYVNQSPLTRDKAKKLDLASPESLNLRRSRSGRLLVPPIARWHQKIIYAADGEITGIIGADMLRYPYVEPPRKKEKLF